MNETQKRIKAYQAALPGLKERVAAVALLLVISIAMMTSATFAWVTLSRAPEVSEVTTNAAANGNLEIALVNPQGTQPGESAVGDSAAAKGTVAANLTWGNLVNLSDESYGLSAMALRPALLSNYNLTQYPLYGAEYGQDGRVISTAERYEFASYKTAADGTKYFAITNSTNPDYGVRAISSVTYENVTGNATTSALWTAAVTAYGDAANLYKLMLTDDSRGYVDSLEGLMTVFVQDAIYDYADQTTVTDCGAYIPKLYEMLLEFKQVMEYEGEALLNMANLQRFLLGDGGKYETLDEFLADASSLSSKNVTLKSLSVTAVNFKTDYNNLVNTCLPGIGEHAQKRIDDPSYAVYWEDVSTEVNLLVDINTAKIDGMTISELMGSTSKLASMVMNSSTVYPAEITKGILRNFEQRTGTCMSDPSAMGGETIQVALTVDASPAATKLGLESMGWLLSNVTMKATLSTNAAAPFQGVEDQAYTRNVMDTTEGGAGDAVAQDIYGMSIDLWARTNAADSYLILEGSTMFKEEQDTGIAMDGNEVPLYTIPVDGLDTDVYYYDTDGDSATDDDLYYLSTHTQVSSETLEELAGNNITPTPKMVQVVDLEAGGYWGPNRVWEWDLEEWNAMVEEGLISEHNTTQGSGSCYIFYADPSDQARILELLRAFSVVFIDENGNKLATAMLDTEYAFGVNGKFTVPLKLVAGAEYTDEDGNTHYAITPLVQNTPARITAIVYLNGADLTNDDVLATGEIEGRLNLQFGSSVSLTAKSDGDLQAKYRTITAKATAAGETSTQENVPIELEYNENGTEVTLTLTVDGDQPSAISGAMLRMINSTQGSRSETVDFTKVEGTSDTWTAILNLTAPGDYILRSVLVDGVEYNFDECPAITISGLNIKYISSIFNNSVSGGVIMTADNYVEADVTVQFEASDAYTPRTVRAQFRSADGGKEYKEYNAILSYDSTNNWWTGTTRITSSGTFILEYIALDGVYEEVPEQYRATVITYLGMSAQVWIPYDHDGDGDVDGDDRNFEFTGSTTISPVLVKVWDNAGTEMTGLTGVSLYYYLEGSDRSEDAMYAPLTWTKVDGEYYYAGEFELAAPGTYSFKRLNVTANVAGTTSTSTITKLKENTSAPEITAYSMDTPELLGVDAFETYQFVPGGTGTISVGIGNIGAAKAWGEFEVTHMKNGVLTEETVYLPGHVTDVDTEAGTGHMAFALGEGEWTLKALYLQNVYDDLGDDDDSTGTWYGVTGEEPGTVDDEGQNNLNDFYCMEISGEPYVYVVSNVYTEITTTNADYAKDTAFGRNASNETTGAFMTSYDVAGFAVTIKDWNGAAIEGLDTTDVKWNIVHQGDSESLGGYSVGEGTVAYGTNVVDLVADSTNTKFTAAAAETFRVAGTYKTKVTYTISGTEYSITGPTYSVYSVKPAVTINSIAPSGEHTTFNSSKSEVKATSKIDGNTATVYVEAKKKGWFGAELVTVPQVTLALSGYGNASDASLTFTTSDNNGTVYMYTGANRIGQTSAFTWTANGNVKRYVGYYDGGNCDGSFPAGTLTSSDKLVLTYGTGDVAETYEVTVGTITIINKNAS